MDAFPVNESDTQGDSEIHHLDVKGLLCPLPVLKARKLLRSLAPETHLTIEATDPASVIDFPHFCSESGHTLVEQSEADGVYRFVIRRKAD
jgi:tRNA 2-thiouridine synthesizing protein A